LTKISIFDQNPGFNQNFDKKLQRKYFKLYLEASWTPIDELNRSFGFDLGNSSINIFGYNITPVEEATRHVLSVTRITFYHLVLWFETGVRNFTNRKLFVTSTIWGDDWSVRGEREVNSWVWDLK